MGEWEDASALLAEADRSLAEVGPDPVVRLGLDWIRGERLIGLGDVGDALTVLARASEEADGLEDLQATSRARLGLARARLAAGDPDGAAEAIDPAIARWEGAAGGSLPAPPTLLLTAVEIAAIGRNAAEAERRGQQIAARLRGHRAAYAAALVELAAGRMPSGGALEAAAGATDAAGWHWEAARMCVVAAEALARAGGARQEARVLAGAARQRLGAIGSQAWSGRLDGLARRLGSGPTAGPVDPAALTPREREVLAMLAEGRSNRAIARELVISEATVVRHVANIYAKLGVHSRAQATRVALERGLVAVSRPT
jgi:DNA-binding CsgD family transcriptional regulator